MAVTASVGHVSPAVRRWSLIALAAAVLGVTAAMALVFLLESDPADVRWWLVVLPVFLALVPLLAPSRMTRISAAVITVGWCLLTGFSIGLLLLPAAVALFVAAKDDG